MVITGMAASRLRSSRSARDPLLVGHEDIADDQIAALALELAQAVLAVDRQCHLVAGALSMALIVPRTISSSSMTSILGIFFFLRTR